MWLPTAYGNRLHNVTGTNLDCVPACCGGMLQRGVCRSSLAWVVGPFTVVWCALCLYCLLQSFGWCAAVQSQQLSDATALTIGLCFIMRYACYGLEFVAPLVLYL